MSSHISDLAALISHHTSLISSHLTTNNLPQPSFNANAPLDLNLTPDLEQSRSIILQATQELNDLLQGPRDLLYNHRPSIFIPIYLQLISRFRIAQHVPIDSGITFHDLSRSTKLNENVLTRILRLAIANRVFTEPHRGWLAHSAASRRLVDDAGMESWLAVAVEEMWPAAQRVCDALVKWPEAAGVEQTGFALANGTEESFYDTLARDPERAQRFGETMTFLASGDGFSMRHVTDGWAWAGLPDAATVVDIGGSTGDTAFALAQAHPKLHVVVQDLPDVVASAKKREGVHVEFMAHDFFTEQPVKEADVYLFRWIMHNWPDKYAIRILRNLVPALKKGARVLVVDFVIPEPGVLPNAAERQVRVMDLVMLQIANAKERDLAEWKTLFEEADERYVFRSATHPEGSKLSIVEVVWEG